jgi:transcriptional antiterminator RfaH
MDSRWYVARTKPLAEYAARDGLLDAGLDVFLPCVQTPRPRNGHQDVPLFPGYLFVRCNLETLSWRRFRWIPHFVGLVRFGDVATWVPDEVITELVERVESINNDGGVRTRLRPGDVISVVLGRGESFAEVVELPRSPQGRVRVLLEFMQRQVYADIPWRYVQAAGVEESRRNSSPEPPRRTRGRSRWIRGHGPKAVAA